MSDEGAAGRNLFRWRGVQEAVFRDSVGGVCDAIGGQETVFRGSLRGSVTQRVAQETVFRGSVGGSL